MRLTAFAIAAVFAAGTANAATLVDFSSQPAGVYGTSIAFPGLFNVSGSRNGNPANLALFNTECLPDCNTTSEDEDLATGSGGGQDTGIPGKGNALILQNPGESEPNDAAEGGIMTFTFFRPTELLSIEMLDIDEVASSLGFTFHLTGGGSVVADGSVFSSFTPNALLTNDGGLSTFLAADLGIAGALLTSFKIDFNDAGSGISGAVAELTVAPIPVPAALPMLVSALGGLALFRRRQRA